MLQRVQEARFVVIAGPSGSGKSSVARAGLFHALRHGRVQGSEKWLLAAMSPKETPIEALAQAMVRLTGGPAAGKHIREEGLTNPLALHEQAEALLSDNPRQRLVLLVDQFEEIFTQKLDAEEREAFIKLLIEAVGVENGRVIVLLILCSDFISNCARFSELQEQINAGTQFRLLGAMVPRDLAKAITLPSLVVGAEIDPALVKQVIDDMKGEPGALPLMSFALRDLFLAEKTVKGQKMDMTLEEYVYHGGLHQALERHANGALESLDEEQQALARARLLAVEGAELNDQIGSPAEQTGSISLLFSLAYEQPVSYQPDAILGEHTDNVRSVAWNGDGSRLASASGDTTVIIWDTGNWQPITTLGKHEGVVRSVAWNGDGSRLASASNDSTIIIWKFPDFSRLQCRLVRRNLSLAEWEEFLPGAEYRCTCAEWPAGEGAPGDGKGCVVAVQEEGPVAPAEDAMPGEAYPVEKIPPTLSAPSPDQAYPGEETTVPSR